FDVRLPIASDWLFWIETLIGGGEIHYIDRVMGKYRRHSNNVTLRKIESYEDHFNTIAIVISRYPKYTKEGLARMSELFLQMRRWDDAKYVSCVTGSKDVKFNWKAYILLFFYYLSFGRIKI
ncbi:MAG: glycosyl transferase 2 family protein, partial [Nitrospirota bacterium]